MRWCSRGRIDKYAAMAGYRNEQGKLLPGLEQNNAQLR
jgi:hypothetical protein